MGPDAGAVPVKRTRSRNWIYDIDSVGNQSGRFTGIPAYAERHGHRLGIRNFLSHLPYILLLRRLHRSGNEGQKFRRNRNALEKRFSLKKRSKQNQILKQRTL